MNSAGKLSSASILRTYAYNVLVDNRWENENFKELVDFTLCLIAKQCEDGSYREPAAALTGSCETALSLWTGSLITKEPALVPHLTRSVVENADSNSKQYNKLSKDFANMYGDRPTHGYMGSSRDDRSYERDDRRGRRDKADTWEYDNRNAPRDWLRDRDDAIAYYKDYRREHPSLGHPEDYEENGRFYWDRSRGGYRDDRRDYRRDERRDDRQGYGRTPEREYGREGLSEERSLSAAESRYANVGRPQPHNTAPQRYVREQPAPAQTPVEDIQQDSIQLLEMEGNSEMNRNDHKVTVAGVETRNTASDRYSRYATAAVAVQEESPKALLQINEEGKLTAGTVKVPGIEIDPTLSLVESLPSAILGARLRLEAAKEKDPNIGILRRMSAIARHVTVKTDFSQIRELLSSSRNLEELSERITGLVEKMSNVSGSNTDTAVLQAREGLSYLNMVDNSLRDILNHFFRYVCGQKDWNVSDFAKGYPSFLKFLNSEGDADSLKAVGEFSDDIMEILRKFTPEDYNGLENFFIPEEAEGKYRLASFPIGASLTLIDMTSSELGYKVGEDARMVDEKNQPALHAIMTSVVDMKSVYGMRGYFNLLVTSDNSVYEFFSDPVVKKDFMIRLHRFL